MRFYRREGFALITVMMMLPIVIAAVALLLNESAAHVVASVSSAERKRLLLVANIGMSDGKAWLTSKIASGVKPEKVAMGKGESFIEARANGESVRVERSPYDDIDLTVNLLDLDYGFYVPEARSIAAPMFERPGAYLLRATASLRSEPLRRVVMEELVQIVSNENTLLMERIFFRYR